MRRWTLLCIGAVMALLIMLMPPTASPGYAQEGVCDTAPPTRLAIGAWARVTDVVTGTATGGLRLRDVPRTTGESVEVLPAGTIARVIDGPACNDGFRWYRLNVYGSGSEGWAAEAFPGNYYLAPTNAPVDPTAPPTAAAQVGTAAVTVVPLFPTNTPRDTSGAVPTDTPETGVTIITSTPAAPQGGTPGADCPDDPTVSYLSVGASVQVVSPVHPVRVRSEPSTDSIVTTVLYPDTDISITGGPTCAEGMRWWMVSFNGRTGWTVEAAGGRYLLMDESNPPPGAIPPPTAVPTFTATPVQTLAPTPRPVTPPDVFRRARYLPDGSALAVGSDDGVRLYDAVTLQLTNVLSIGPVLDFALIGTELYAVTWAPEGVRVVSVPASQTRTTILGGPYDPAWAAAAPDGEWLILGPTSDGAPATLWDMRTGMQSDVPPYWWSQAYWWLPDREIAFAAFTPDGRYVLIDDIFYDRTCDYIGTGCQFDLIRQDYLTASGFRDVDWTADGGRMIGINDRFWLWDVDPIGVGFTIQTTLGPNEPRRAAIGGDSANAAVAAGSGMEQWNLEVYNASGVDTLPGAVRSLDFNRDGTQLAVAAGESVIVYDVASGEAIRQVE